MTDPHFRPHRSSRHVLSAFVRVLVIVAVAEAIVMLELPYLAPGLGAFATAMVDAGLLTLLVTPALWGLVALPLADAVRREEAASAERERALRLAERTIRAMAEKGAHAPAAPSPVIEDEDTQSNQSLAS